MPADERDLDAEHGRLASLSQDKLVEQGRDLADTDAYRGALRSLNSVLEEGYQHVRQKNVELWKDNNSSSSGSSNNNSNSTPSTTTSTTGPSTTSTEGIVHRTACARVARVA